MSCISTQGGLEKADRLVEVLVDRLVPAERIRVGTRGVQLGRTSKTRKGLRLLLLQGKAVPDRDPRLWRLGVRGKQLLREERQSDVPL